MGRSKTTLLEAFFELFLIRKSEREARIRRTKRLRIDTYEERERGDNNDTREAVKI